MESTVEEEEETTTSFKSRVDKVFGSLSSSKPAWSLLTPDDVDNKPSRTRRHIPSPTDDEDDDRVLPSASSSSRGPNHYNNNNNNNNNNNKNEFGDGGGEEEEWEIRSSIGLDPTLDYEAEEDEYDKVAEGRENAGDRLYMSAVTDHGPFLNSHNVLPHSVHEAVKDSRANHQAAKARLEEDKAESTKFRNPLSRVVNYKPKPVLKMKGSSSSKAQRRVRFDPYIKNNPEESNTDNLATPTPAVQTTAADYQAWVENSPMVPDYLLNPTKYTRYTFDSTSKVDDMEVLDSNIRSDHDGVPTHQPKFTPRKKESGATPMDSISTSSSKNNAKQSVVACVIAAEEIQISDDMDVEDEQGVEKADKFKIENQKPNRRYRPRPNIDDPIT